MYFLPPLSHTLNTHSHTCTHTCTHTQNTHTRTHIHMPKCPHTCVHAHTCTHTVLAQPNTHAHMCVHTPNTHMHICALCRPGTPCPSAMWSGTISLQSLFQSPWAHMEALFPGVKGWAAKSKERVRHCGHLGLWERWVTFLVTRTLRPSSWLRSCLLV